MYYRHIETSSQAMAQHNATMKQAAAARLKDMPHHRQPDCAQNSKAVKKLSIRVADWDRAMNDPLNRNKFMQGYNKPGSMKG